MRMGWLREGDCGITFSQSAALHGGIRMAGNN
jgi:hypothetical protein